jgi:hypothetical protein
MGIFRGLLIDFIRSVKAQYVAADPAGKATVLSVAQDEVVLRPTIAISAESVMKAQTFIVPPHLGQTIRLTS